MANNTTEKKLTKKDYFTALRHFIEGEDTIDGIDADEVIKFIDHEMELLSKKKASSANNPKKKENESYKQIILDILAATDEPMTIADIYAESEELSTALNGSNQRISALLTQLKNDGIIIRSEVKGKAHFAVNPAEVNG